MFASKTVVIRGTERYHMENFLIERGFRREGADTFISDNAGAFFEAQRRTLVGSLPIAEVEIHFEGEAGRVHGEAEAIKLRFMTAGG